MKKLGVFVTAILLMGASQLGMAADKVTDSSLKVAVVNVQQVLQQSPKVVQLTKKLENEFKPRQQKINDQQKALEAQLESFKKESLTMSQKDKDATQKKISDERANLLKQVVAYQQDLSKEQNKIMRDILSNLNSVVSNLAKKDNFNLVLDSQAVIYSSNGTDLTKDVASQFNK